MIYVGHKNSKKALFIITCFVFSGIVQYFSGIKLFCSFKIAIFRILEGTFKNAFKWQPLVIWKLPIFDKFVFVKG